MSTALDTSLNAIDDLAGGNPDAGLAVATARGLMYGYDARWSDAQWTMLHDDQGRPAIEEEYHLPIVNPDSGKPSRTFTHAGKLDGRVGFRGKRFLMEHKTSSEDIADPNAPYWRRLEIDAQVSGYMLAQWQEGDKLDGTLYDVIRKPGIRPKQVTRGGRLETPAEFEQRLAEDVAERPEWYYQRRTIYRMDAQILEYARELWETADEVRLARLHNRHYRNSGACMQWGRPCEYLGICSGHDTPDSDRWAKRAGVHAELPVLSGASDGRGVLTNSRVGCFKTCRRKHYYRYELGIERAEREEVESLYFGTLIHHALAAWWQCQVPQPEVSHEYGTGPAVTAAAGQSVSAETPVAR